MADHRQVTYSARYESDRKELEGDVGRWDEIFRGVEWELLHIPERGQTTSVPGVFAIATDDWPGAPPLVVYYDCTDDQVNILGVRPADVGPNDSEE